MACRFLENLCTFSHNHIVWECVGVTLIDVMMTGQTFNPETYISMMKELRCFSLTRNQHKSPFSITVYGCTQVWCLWKPPQKFGGECYTTHPTTLIKHPHISTYLKPSKKLSKVQIAAECWCDSHNDSLATWAGKYMVTIRQTHLYSWFIQGTLSRWRCGKTGYGGKSSLFTVCNFMVYK